jgi:hypothetical protein
MSPICGDVIPRILDLDIGEQSASRHKRFYSLGKGHSYQFFIWLDANHSRSERCGKQKNVLPLPGIEP